MDGGVSSTRSTKGVSSWAAAVSATAQMAESEQALPMVRRRPAPSPAPNCCAMRTEKPCASP